MAVQKLSLTRDQLASFLKDFEQIKQFERLFALADQVAPSADTTGISIQAGIASSTANDALAQIIKLAQDTGVNGDNKGIEALDAFARISNTLDMLALTPRIEFGTIALKNTGATGTFTTVDLKTITVKDGIITSIV